MVSKFTTRNSSMKTEMSRLFDRLPAGEWVCWNRPPVMYVCYDSDNCSYYPMDTGIEYRGPFPLFSWEYALATDGRGGFYVTGGHDENRQVRVRDPYSVNHKPPFPDSFFGPIISELWRFDIRNNAWTEVDQETWGPRQCIGARFMTYDSHHDRLIRAACCGEGHSPPPPVPLRGWGTFGIWTYDIRSRRWTWMGPSDKPGPLTYDTQRRVVLAYRDGSVRVYDPHSNTIVRRPARRGAPAGEGPFVYDRSHDLCLFLGNMGDLWSYDIDANTWTQRRSVPAPRARFAFALDPETGTGLLYGGRHFGVHQDDTWMYNVEADRWKAVRCKMKPDARFWSGPGMMFDEATRAFVIYAGLAKYERVKARYATGDVWLFKLPPPRKLAPPPLPAPAVRIECTKKAVRLFWKSVRGAASYVVQAGTGKPGAVRFRSLMRLPSGATSCTDTTIQPGNWRQYRVGAASRAGRLGPWSSPVRTDPAVPTGLVVSVAGKRRVELRWTASPEPDAAGYRVRRVRVAGNERTAAEKIMDAGRRTTFVDAPGGSPKRHHQYQVRAVNRLGVAGGWSAPAGTIPSAPARLAMKPDAARRTIELRWPASPEKGIVGYNIYRWVEPPFRFAFRTEPDLITPAWWTFDPKKNPAERMEWVKVNGQPIAGTRFVDRRLKRVSVWYYIRAVNKLGVEGHYRTSYSMPVWRWYTDARRFF